VTVQLCACVLAAAPTASVADVDTSSAVADGNHLWGLSALTGPRVGLDGSGVLLDVTVAAQRRVLRRRWLEVSVVAPLSGRAHASRTTELGVTQATSLYALELVPSVRAAHVWAAHWAVYADAGLGMGLLGLEEVATFQGGTVQWSALGVARLAVGVQWSLGERFFAELQPAELRFSFGSSTGIAYVARAGLGVRL
jgi:hypothetical protein